MELGELYRELRIARGLKLKDVVRDNLSLSQLSRFENGQTMLSADRMLLAISGIHMTFAEFGYALNNYKETPYFAVGKKIMELYGKQDVEGLKGLLEEYKDYELLDYKFIVVNKETLNPLVWEFNQTKRTDGYTLGDESFRGWREIVLELNDYLTLNKHQPNWVKPINIIEEFFKKN